MGDGILWSWTSFVGTIQAAESAITQYTHAKAYISSHDLSYKIEVHDTTLEV